MVSSEVQRRLVKSPPELWAELSDPDALRRHLGELGEIRIVRTTPEQFLEWECEATRGRIELKPAGWGTQVTLSVAREASAAEREPVSVATPELVPAAMREPVPAQEPKPEPRQGFFARLFKRWSRRAPEPTDAQEPSPEEIAAQQAAAEKAAAERAAAEEKVSAWTTEMLTSVLDRLGAAHHRPFSRA